MPLVSIVLPTYNRSDLIGKSIDTCLNQTFQDIELIVVNDCSTDDTAIILKDYAARDSRIKIINNEVNLKLPASLNRGFAAATGKYFTWTSDDNLYTPIAIDTMAQALEAAPDTGLVYANYKEIDDDNKIVGEYVLGDVNKSFMLWKGCGACFMYRAEIQAMNNGYDTSLFLVEDFDFFIRAWLKNQFLYLNRSDLYLYRHHSDSLTSLNTNAVFELTKIRIEKLQKALFLKISDYDKMLFYRKYSVYYAVKNNITRANQYLHLLWKTSKKNYCITFVYIIVQKVIAVFKVGFGMTIGFLKIVFSNK